MTDVGAFAQLGLLLVRPGMLVVTAPSFGGTYAPPQLKIGLTLLLALSMLPVAPIPDVAAPGLTTAIVAREAIIGMSLGFGVRVLTAGAEFAGHLAGSQLGFAYASVIDPQAGARNSVLSSMYGLIALLVFLVADGHHQFVRALAQSYAALPVGLGHIDGSLGATVARLLAFVFVVGIQLAAPVVIALLVVEVGLGLMARSAPMLNLMAQGFPVRLVVGLLTVAAIVPVIPEVVRRGIPVVLELAARLAQAFR